MLTAIRWLCCCGSRSAVCTSAGSRPTGKLSMQLNPASSSTCSAVLFPEPERPLMMTSFMSSGAVIDALSVRLWPRVLSRCSFPCA